MDDKLFGNAFQNLKQQMRKTWMLPWCILRGGTHIDKDEEEKSARDGTYRGIIDARWDGSEIVVP